MFFSKHDPVANDSIRKYIDKGEVTDPFEGRVRSMSGQCEARSNLIFC